MAVTTETTMTPQHRDVDKGHRAPLTTQVQELTEVNSQEETEPPLDVQETTESTMSAQGITESTLDVESRPITDATTTTNEPALNVPGRPLTTMMTTNDDNQDTTETTSEVDHTTSKLPATHDTAEFTSTDQGTRTTMLSANDLIETTPTYEGPVPTPKRLLRQRIPVVRGWYFYILIFRMCCKKSYFLIAPSSVLAYNISRRYRKRGPCACVSIVFFLNLFSIRTVGYVI